MVVWGSQSVLCLLIALILYLLPYLFNKASILLNKCGTVSLQSPKRDVMTESRPQLKQNRYSRRLNWAHHEINTADNLSGGYAKGICFAVLQHGGKLKETISFQRRTRACWRQRGALTQTAKIQQSLLVLAPCQASLPKADGNPSWFV